MYAYQKPKLEADPPTHASASSSGHSRATEKKPGDESLADWLLSKNEEERKVTSEPPRGMIIKNSMYNELITALDDYVELKLQTLGEEIPRIVTNVYDKLLARYDLGDDAEHKLPQGGQVCSLKPSGYEGDGKAVVGEAPAVGAARQNLQRPQRVPLQDATERVINQQKQALVELVQVLGSLDTFTGNHPHGRLYLELASTLAYADALFCCWGGGRVLEKIQEFKARIDAFIGSPKLSCRHTSIAGDIKILKYFGEGWR